MFIKLFKSNHQVLLSVLFIMGAIIWIPSLVNPLQPQAPRETEIFYKLIYNIVIQFHPSISVLLAFGLLFLQSVVLNNLVINHSLNDKNTFLPSLIYFVLMSILPQFCTLNPILISNLVILLCLDTILKIYLKEESFAAVFNISFFIAVLSFFYQPASFYILFVWLSFFIYRIFKWREWFISIIAFLLPFALMAFYFFWHDNLVFMNNFLSIFHYFRVAPDYKNPQIIILILLQAFILFAALKYQNYTQDKIVMLRKFSGIVISLYAVSILSLYAAKGNWLIHLVSTFLPASIFISYFFNKIKKTWIPEIIFLIFIAIIFINRLFTF